MKILSKNLMIRASAGSGKTYQLSNRVIGLVGRAGVDPERIVALTFTRKAAGEFADAVLEKLAKAALDPAERARIEDALGGPFEPMEVLEKVVRALPRLALGTMDSFFTRVVRGFQYELGVTGGSFELLEGPQRRAKLDALLGGLVGNAMWDEDAEEFLAAFRRATMGREQKAVVELLLGFFDAWQDKWREHGAALDEGLARVFGDLPEVEEWEREKAKRVGGLRSAAQDVEWTRKGQGEAMEKALVTFEKHTIGSGSLGGATGFLKGMLEWRGDEVLVLKHYKEVAMGPVFEDRLRDLMRLLVGCELAAAVERTRAVLRIVAEFDAACERQLRRRGLLGFDDVKVLMGEWLKTEAGRLRREAVDFRLDARYDHWLLDEFQDTSGAQWNGLLPWIEEAASDDASTMFVVGDAKQAIYGWRGGDVRLFDVVRDHFRLSPESMPVSRRSCGAVLDFVNRVGGNDAGIREAFGPGLANRWAAGWERHEPADASLSGYVRVEVTEGKESELRYERVVGLLEEIGAGKKALSCGVLVRTNDQVVALADRLREAGFQVIEEGRRRPTEDHAVGVALRALIAWLADPADGMERGVVAMSPLVAELDVRFGGFWQARWEGLLTEVEAKGYGGMLEDLVAPLRETLSDFGHGRAMDVIRALETFDAEGGGGPRDALLAIEKLEVAQEPGSAAVQVMTMHKAKGLGFDVVILPEISDEQVPNAGKFEIAAGPDWLLQPPAQWVRQQVPALREAEERWGEAQRYEALCLLYVALTRAKRGLYVVLPGVSGSRDKGPWASSAELVRSACGVDGREAGVMCEIGAAGWLDALPRREVVAGAPPPMLARPKALRSRSTPSGEKPVEGKVVASATGRKFGSEVHAAFEAIGWLDEEEPRFPAGDGAMAVRELLGVPEIRARFERRGGEVALFREQPVEAIVEGKWLSGVIDRLHVIDGGQRVEVIDFKTDAVTTAEELRERYAGQVEAYRRVVKGIYPQAEVTCLLLSTKLGEWVEIGGKRL